MGLRNKNKIKELLGNEINIREKMVYATILPGIRNAIMKDIAKEIKEKKEKNEKNKI